MANTLSFSALVLLLLHTSSFFALGDPADAVEPGEDLTGEEEEEGELFDGILEDLALTHLAGPETCDGAHLAELGDRVYLEYAGIEHATGEVFAANTRVGQLALIVRLGEKQVLPGESTCVESARLEHLSQPGQ